jgi:hypothetical protein
VVCERSDLKATCQVYRFSMSMHNTAITIFLMFSTSLCRVVLSSFSPPVVVLAFCEDHRYHYDPLSSLTPASLLRCPQTLKNKVLMCPFNFAFQTTALHTRMPHIETLSRLCCFVANIGHVLAAPVKVGIGASASETTSRKTHIVDLLLPSGNQYRELIRRLEREP